MRFTKPDIVLKGLDKMSFSFNYNKAKGVQLFSENNEKMSTLEVSYQDLKSKSGIFKKCGKTISGTFVKMPLTITAINEKEKQLRRTRPRPGVFIAIIGDAIDSATAPVIWMRTSDRIIVFGRKKFGLLKWKKSRWIPKPDRIMTYLYQLGKWVVYVHNATKGSVIDLKMDDVIEAQVFYRGKLYAVAKKEKSESGRYSFYLNNEKFINECFALLIAAIDGVDTYNYHH